MSECPLRIAPERVIEGNRHRQSRDLLLRWNLCRTAGNPTKAEPLRLANRKPQDTETWGFPVAALCARPSWSVIPPVTDSLIGNHLETLPYQVPPYASRTYPITVHLA